MTSKRITMAIQEEIKRLKTLGHSQVEVARLLGINRETVRKYWHGTPSDIPQMIPQWAQEVDWDYVYKEVDTKRASRKIIYEELIESIQLPTYQAFCDYYRNHKKEKAQDVVIKIERSPGASIEVDYSGDGWEILNPATGQLHKVELFVGSLSYSGHFFAEFTYTQKLEDFINSHIKMFEYFGGASRYIIPDNCKTAVTRSDKHDPQINPTYQDLCKHYNVVVDPADPYSPRHKPNVENAVKLIQTDFFPRIRNKTFTSIFELNLELKKWLKKKSQEVIQGRGESREYFYNKEKTSLANLPDQAYELYYFKKAKVHPDCHFQHQKNYYSVPYTFVGKEIDVKFNSKLVHAYSDCKRVATHKRVSGTYHYSTNPNHYPENKYIEFNYHIQLAKREANKIGPWTSALIEKLINKAAFPLKILRKVQGILSLSKKFEREAMEHACKQALEFDRLNYDNVRRFAKSYRRPRIESTNKPIRQLEFACLQGGLSERNN